jgi:hypothetical protein
MGFAVFSNLPSSEDIQMFLDRTIQASGASPKHLISDKGGSSGATATRPGAVAGRSSHGSAPLGNTAVSRSSNGSSGR